MDDIFDTSTKAECDAAANESFNDWAAKNLTEEMADYRDLLLPVWKLAHNRGASWGINRALVKTKGT